jgi:type VI protein secretion system component VasF
MTPRLLLQAQPAPTTTSQSPDDRATEFKPAENVQERYSGAALMVWAYVFFWLLAFFFVLRSLMRQRSIDDRIDRLERDLAKARSKATAKESSDADA